MITFMDEIVFDFSRNKHSKLSDNGNSRYFIPNFNPSK